MICSNHKISGPWTVGEQRSNLLWSILFNVCEDKVIHVYTQLRPVDRTYGRGGSLTGIWGKVDLFGFPPPQKKKKKINWPPFYSDCLSQKATPVQL